MDFIYRAFWGLLGGWGACLAKYAGQDHPDVQAWIHSGDTTSCWEMLYGYLVLAAVLGLAGAIIAAASTEEKHPMKLMAIAVAAPALFTTYIGRDKPSETAYLPNFSIISQARAENIAPPPGSVQEKPSVWRGIRMVLGYDRPVAYRVIAGSYKNPTEAAVAASRVRTIMPDQNPVYVGERNKDNEYYPVIVGEPAAYKSADTLRAEVADKTGIADAYLSPFRAE